tara:strand:- start:241 stop:489 length:249 start_codon:yes stop_codon:yes gene_type:complete
MADTVKAYKKGSLVKYHLTRFGGSANRLITCCPLRTKWAKEGTPLVVIEPPNPYAGSRMYMKVLEPNGRKAVVQAKNIKEIE